MAATLDRVLTLAPDRIALFGYAHVPHMAKRQKLIDAAVLPGDEARHAVAAQAAARFTGAGFKAIGIDHFALPTDSLAGPPPPAPCGAISKVTPTTVVSRKRWKFSSTFSGLFDLRLIRRRGHGSLVRLAA